MSNAATTTLPISTLLETCKTACDEITELVEVVYEQLGKEPGAAVLKEDKSFFSLADGVVQVGVCPTRRARALPLPPDDNPLTNDAESSMLTTA